MNDNAPSLFVVPNAAQTALGSFLIYGGAWSPELSPRVNLSRELKSCVWSMTWGQCFYCGTNYLNPFSNLIIEHVVPLAKGGTNEIENLVPACSFCNDEKGTLLLDEWRVHRPYGNDPGEYPWLREWIDEHGQPVERPAGLCCESRLTDQFFFERWDVFQLLRRDEINAHNRMAERRRQGVS